MLECSTTRSGSKKLDANKFHPIRYLCGSSALDSHKNMFFVLVNARYFVTARSGVGGGGRPVGAGATGAWGRGAGGGRYVSAVAADGDARNADDLQMPSAPPPMPAAYCVLAYLWTSRRRRRLHFSTSRYRFLTLTNCQDNSGRNLKDKRLRLFEMPECKPNHGSF